MNIFSMQKVSPPACMHFAVDTNRRMYLGWSCWGTALFLSPAATGAWMGHLWCTCCMCEECSLCCWGREEAGKIRSSQERGNDNIQREREIGCLGKLQKYYLTGSQCHSTTSLAHCSRHFFQLVSVSHGHKCLPSSTALSLVCFSAASKKTPTAFFLVQFLWIAA